MQQGVMSALRNIKDFYRWTLFIMTPSTSVFSTFIQVHKLSCDWNRMVCRLLGRSTPPAGRNFSLLVYALMRLLPQSLGV